jgi:subtilisin family serine protease
MASDVVRIREGADISAATVRPRLGSLEPEDRTPGKIHFCGRTDHGSAAGEALHEFPDELAPEYVLIAQQRVQPATDPEHAAPLPPIPAGTQLGQNVKIAVVDTGVADQDGARKVWNEGNGGFGNDDFDPLYDIRTLNDGMKLAWAAGHGTFIASLIRQVVPAAEIIPIRACSPMGYETEDEVARGIEAAVARDVDIINLSWCSYALVAGHDPEGQATYDEPLRLRAAVETAIAHDIVVVAAAGNSASPDPMYPAAWPDVLAVGALDRDGRRWEHSNYGKWVGAWALGEDLRGVYVRGEENPANDPDGHAEVWDHPETNYATWTGTSFAAPLVAAQIAIVQSALGVSAPDAKETLLKMSHAVMGGAGGGKRIMVDVPGQT